MTKVRSEYIKKLMNESHKLDEKLKEVAESTINSILEEKTKSNLRQILSEDENSFSEEEVEDTDEPVEANEVPTEEEGAVEDDVDGADDEEWEDLEKYKDENGEYDLRSMDKDELVKVLKVMSPDDAVRIVKNDDDTLTVTDESNDEEYELELDDDSCDTDEFGADDANGEDGEVEIEVGTDDDLDDEETDVDFDDDLSDEDDDIEIELDEASLGYTDNYQKKTAMTTPDNHEPADAKSTYSMDGGVPTGTEKPWVGTKQKQPFDDEVSESYEVEEDCIGGSCDVDTDAPIKEGAGEFGKNRHVTKQHRNTSSMHGGMEDEKVKSWGGEYEPTVSESIKKKANQIFVENKQLKKLMGKLQNQVNEAIVVNQSLANVIKLINENATTVNEKKEILRRFNECTTREESNKLYSTISEELKRDGKKNVNMAETINAQLSESRNRSVETPMYQSQDLSDTLSFMKRLNAIK